MNDDSSGAGGDTVSSMLSKNPEAFVNGGDYGGVMPSSALMSSPVKSEPSVPQSPTSRSPTKVPIEELLTRTLPDYLRHDLDMIFIGINPGLVAAEKQKYYAGSGNHFWKGMYAAGVIPEQMTAEDDHRLPDYGIGLTNMVERTTRGSNDLTSQEMREGGEILLKKLKEYEPKIAVFNGKEIYRIFSGKKDFFFGKQPHPIEGTSIQVFVMPSSSARCAQLPRVSDKIPYFEALRKLRDHLRGCLPGLQDEEITFTSALKSPSKRKSMEEDPPLNGANGGSPTSLGALDLSQGLPSSFPGVKTEPDTAGIFDPFNPQESHFSGSGQQDELERLLAGNPLTEDVGRRAEMGEMMRSQESATSTSLPTSEGFNHNIVQGIAQESFHKAFPSPGMMGQQASSTADDLRLFHPATTVEGGGFTFSGGTGRGLKEELTDSPGMSMASVQAQAPPLPATVPSPQQAVKKQPSSTSQSSDKMDTAQSADIDLVSQHIRECVAAVVQRCKDGTQDFPEHYIRPSTPPGARAAQQIQHHQQQSHVAAQNHQSQHHHQRDPAQITSSQQQQHTPPQEQQGSAGAGLLYQAQQGGRGGSAAAANQVALDAAQYLNPYFQQQQQLAAAYGIPGLQRAMQGAAGNQWPAADFYNAYLSQTQQQQSQQQAVHQAQQQQFRQQQQQGGQDLYGGAAGAYFGAAQGGYGTQNQHGSQQGGAGGQHNY